MVQGAVVHRRLLGSALKSHLGGEASGLQEGGKETERPVREAGPLAASKEGCLGGIEEARASRGAVGVEDDAGVRCGPQGAAGAIDGWQETAASSEEPTSGTTAALVKLLRSLRVAHVGTAAGALLNRSLYFDMSLASLRPK